MSNELTILYSAEATAEGGRAGHARSSDGRLDVAASTTAALSLIERYQKEFGDWRLADMAFNSGEYRVKNLLKGRDAHSLTAAELGKLAFNQITHDHLDRLLALSCIVADPARFGVTLPEPSADDRLKTIILQSGMDVRLAARLANQPAVCRRDGRIEALQRGLPAQSHGIGHAIPAADAGEQRRTIPGCRAGDPGRVLERLARAEGRAHERARVVGGRGRHSGRGARGGELDG